MGVCNKCSKQIKSIDLKVCSKCKSSYHYQCLGISPDNFSKESRAYKGAWKCSDCKTSEKQVEKFITPQSEGSSTTPSFNSPLGNSNEDLKQYIDKKLEESLSRLLLDIRNNFSVESSDTRSKIQELTESVNYMTSKYDQLKKALDTEIKKVGDLEHENKVLQCQVSDLNNKLNQFEQLSRDCNLEIQCVPERKSENLKTILHELTSKIDCKLSEHELVNFHRVAKINQQSTRPRSIVVRLSSPLVRDRVIAAIKSFNKSHINDKLNTSHLGLDGEKKPIYVCEHLSPSNKQLHAEVRKLAKEKNYQFVWVRNGRIFIRKDVNSKSFVVKDFEFLKSL